jgi:hypothetical protein
MKSAAQIAISDSRMYPLNTPSLKMQVLAAQLDMLEN